MKKRIGIIGGGQLGRMLTEAAQELGHTVTVLEQTVDCPAAQVGARQIVGGLKDQNAIRQLSFESDVVTWEIEHIDTEILRTLQQEGVIVHPSAETLQMIQDKLSQKQFLADHGIPVAEFCSLSGVGANLPAQTGHDSPLRLSFPLLIKTRFGGYDGRGNYVVKNKKDLVSAMDYFARQPVYAEQMISFTKELAVIAARSVTGEIRTYPVVETIHKDNICHIVRAPAPIPEPIAKKAEQVAQLVLSHLQGAGVFCIEMFLTKEGSIVVNEIAPRVHNSGHWTIEGAVTSQFEQHIRAITGDRLGETAMKAPAAVMINILSDRIGPAHAFGIDTTAGREGVYIHLYGKKETRPQRKMGHITVLGKTIKEAEKTAREVREKITI